MTAAEKVRTLESLLILEHTLGRSIAALRTYRDLFADFQQTLTLNVRIPELEGELAKIRSEQIAYIADASQFSAPSTDQLKLIKEKSQELDSLTLAAGAGNTILNLVATGLQTWRDANPA